MEDTQDLKEHLQEYRENLWRVLRKQVSLEEAEKICSWELGEPKEDSIWEGFAWGLYQLKAYEHLRLMGHIDESRVFNYRTTDYESDKDQFNDLGRKGSTLHIFIGDEGWVSAENHYPQYSPSLSQLLSEKLKDDDTWIDKDNASKIDKFMR